MSTPTSVCIGYSDSRTNHASHELVVGQDLQGNNRKRLMKLPACVWLCDSVWGGEGVWGGEVCEVVRVCEGVWGCEGVRVRIWTILCYWYCEWNQKWSNWTNGDTKQSTTSHRSAAPLHNVKTQTDTRCGISFGVLLVQLLHFWFHSRHKHMQELMLQHMHRLYSCQFWLSFVLIILFLPQHSTGLWHVRLWFS